MDTKKATIILVAGAGLVFLGSLISSTRLAGIQTTAGQLGEKRLSFRDERRNIQDLKAELAPMSPDNYESTGAKMDEILESEKQLEKKEEKELEGLREELQQKQIAFMTGALTPIYVKLLGAIVMAIGTFFLVFKGGELERAVAIFVSAIVLPRLLEEGLLALGMLSNIF